MPGMQIESKTHGCTVRLTWHFSVSSHLDVTSLGVEQEVGVAHKQGWQSFSCEAALASLSLPCIPLPLLLRRCPLL